MRAGDSVTMVNWASGGTQQMTAGMVAGAIISTSPGAPLPSTTGVNRMVFLFVASRIENFLLV